MLMSAEREREKESKNTEHYGGVERDLRTHFDQNIRDFLFQDSSPVRREH